MIFGGWGRKTKARGELIYPCLECERITPYALIENYGYAQLYGIRLAKRGTDRLMSCAECQRGWDLSKDQWNRAKLLAKELDDMPGDLSRAQMNQFIFRVADGIFPEQSDSIREIMSDEPVQELEEAPVPHLESGDTKTCPDCAEPIKRAARKCRFCGYRYESEVGAG